MKELAMCYERRLVIVLCFLAVWLRCAGTGLAGEPLRLAANGASDYVICVDECASAVQKTAAAELAEYLRQVTGAAFPVVAEAGERPLIVVGPSPVMRRLLPDLDVGGFKDDEILIRTAGRNLVLAGHPQRGALYAVYSFLEDVVGLRWWSSEESFVPRRPTLEIPPLDVRHAPQLIYREAYYRDAFDGKFAARLKLNGNGARIPPEFGGKHSFVYFVHSFYLLIPPDRYFADHPEWFSEIDGKRRHEHAQLCLTNGGVCAELTRNALAALRKNPQSKFISISQNDWHGRCECERCKAVEAEEGAASGPLLRFVNRVAEEIGKEFPDVFVETLAYQYTRKPPLKARPRDNVVIRLCTIEATFLRPLADGGANSGLVEDFDGWSRIAPRLFVWDYVTNFHGYMLPHPNQRVLGPNLKFFVRHNTIGLFEQGDSYCLAGDFVRLRAWVLAHLMWDPDACAEQLTGEFLDGYYGAAAAHLRNYIDLVHDRAGESGVDLRCFMRGTSEWLDLDTLNRATEHFDRALAAVKEEPVLKARVLRERIPLDHVWLRRYPHLKRQACLREVEFRGPEDPLVACNDLLERAAKAGVDAYREYSKRFLWKDYRADFLARCRSLAVEAEVPEPCKSLGPGEWIDMQEHEFWLLEDRKLVAFVDDAKASNGRAVRMPGDHREWAMHRVIPKDIIETGSPDQQWHIHAAVRIETADGRAGDPGAGMTLGLYDMANRKNEAHRRLVVSAMNPGSGDYELVDLGVHPITTEMYLWAAPPERGDVVKAVYVDRFLMIRVPGKPESIPKNGAGDANRAGSGA